MRHIEQWITSWITPMAFTLLASSVALAEWEGATFGVEDYGSGTLCCPGCSDLTYPKNDAAWVRDGLVNIGYEQVRLNQDGGVDGRDWMDHSLWSAGADHVDPYGTDFANVVFYSGHGSRLCGPTYYYSSIVMGQNNDTLGETCYPNTRSHIRFANGGAAEETQVLIVAACQSMHYCVWQHGGYNAVDQGKLGTRFTTYNGFHGISYDYSSLQIELKIYVQDSDYNDIGSNWVQDLTGLYWFSTDQCATTMIYGATKADRDNQYNNGGFKDPKDTGVHSGSSYYFVCGCDPDDGEKLPDC